MPPPTDTRRFHDIATDLPRVDLGKAIGIRGNLRADTGQASSQLRLEVITSGAGMRELSRDWSALATRAGNGHHIFQTYGWCISWWDNHCSHTVAKERNELRIIAGWQDERLVMVWPLVIARRGSIDVAIWLGAPLTQYGDVLIEKGPFAAQRLALAWDMICSWSDIDVISLRKIRSNSPLHDILAERATEVGTREEAPFVDLTEFADWDEYRSTLRTKSRKQQDRFTRNLEKAGTVTFEVDASLEAAVALTGEALAMKRAWLESNGKISDAIADGATGDLLAQLVAYDGSDVSCHAAALRLDGRAVAVEIGLAAKQHYCSFIGAYDPEFAHLRTGNIELEKMIRWTLENDFASYDLLAPSDTYKQRWSTGHIEITDFGLPVSLKGMAFVDLYMKRLRPALKRVYYRLPAPLRSAALDLRSRTR